MQLYDMIMCSSFFLHKDPFPDIYYFLRDIFTSPKEFSKEIIMKFLIALSILASSTVFAQDHRNEEIRCYESARQNGRGDVVYIMESHHEGLELVYPDRERLENRDGCLTTEENHPSNLAVNEDLTFCRGEGQRVNGLVPVEVFEDRHGRDRHDSETVYCDREILRYFNHHGGPHSN